jgi:hypothetical protein
VQVSQSEGGKGGVSKEVALTRMLIVLSVLFMVCSLPSIIVRIVPFIVKDFQLGGRMQNIFMLMVSLLHLFPAINSSLNFFFYMYMGSKFRATFFSLCCRGAGAGGGSRGALKGGDSQTMLSEMSVSHVNG